MAEATNKIFAEFNLTGICIVNTPIVIEKWDDQCFISQWHEKYTLVCDGAKAVISKQQAKEIIVELDLMPEQSPIFLNGKTWRKQ